jgi:hypothetical protein
VVLKINGKSTVFPDEDEKNDLICCLAFGPADPKIPAILLVRLLLGSY